MTHRPGRRFRALAGRTLIGALILVVAVPGALLLLQQSLVGRLDRVDVHPSRLPASEARHRPGLDVAVIGSSEHRFVTLMVLHVAQDGSSASFLSFPRGLPPFPWRWNRIDPHELTRSQAGRILRSVQDVTRTRMDHLAVLEWSGIADLADRLGGVELTVHEEVADERWHDGVLLRGRDVADFIGARIACCPSGDAEHRDEVRRIGRQQRLLDAVLQRSLEQEIAYHPVRLYRILRTLTGALSLDAEWSTAELRAQALSLRRLRTSQIDYVTFGVT